MAKGKGPRRRTDADAVGRKRPCGFYKRHAMAAGAAERCTNQRRSGKGGPEVALQVVSESHPAQEDQSRGCKWRKPDVGYRKHQGSELDAAGSRCSAGGGGGELYGGAADGEPCCERGWAAGRAYEDAAQDSRGCYTQVAGGHQAGRVRSLYRRSAVRAASSSGSLPSPVGSRSACNLPDLAGAYNSTLLTREAAEDLNGHSAYRFLGDRCHHRFVPHYGKLLYREHGTGGRDYALRQVSSRGRSRAELEGSLL